MMDGDNGGGLLARLRANETLRKFSGGRPDLLIFGAPVALIAIVAAVTIGIVAASGGGGNDEQANAATPTQQASASATPGTTATQVGAGLKTPIATTPGDELSLTDLANRGSGPAPRGDFTGSRILIPSIGVDAPFSLKQVPIGGAMPNPDGPTDVAYYDFGLHPGLGGVPGLGGNVVVAGHVDYIRHGPAVFWDLHNLKVGDRVMIQLSDGATVEYAIEFNKFITVGDADWTAIVAGTADESITLITCGGEFSAGHYANRQILWGRRVT